MSSIDVAGCAAAVVSAFHGGADLLQALRDKSDKKKRRKEKEIEQAHEEKMLHKALIDGARQVQLAMVDRRQRYGPAFDVGDATATSELKDIMMNLQMEVISVLQLARSLADTALECSPLYESAITNKTAAVRAMDDLCQRIVMTFQSQRQFEEGIPASVQYRPLRRDPSTVEGHHRSLGETSLKYRTQPTAISPYLSGTSASVPLRKLTHTTTTAQGMDPHMPRVSSKVSAYYKGTGRSSGVGEQDEVQDTEPAPSLHDSAIGRDDVLRRRLAASITSTVLSDETVESSGSVESGAKRDNVRIVQLGDRAASIASGESNASDASTPAQQTANMLQRFEFEDEEDAHRANSAPEVVTKEFEPLMLSPSSRKSPVSPQTPVNPLDFRNVHPALRPDSAYSDVLAPEPERLWTPLHRPAKHNNYHGFCKGAWTCRQTLQEGLAIALIPNYKGQNVPHWKCKNCEFRSRGLNNSKILPNQIYFSTNGVRYRWLFLAKSHVPALKAHSKPELYAYGCIFCAAQGRQTAVYENLDKMMEHIVNKHRTDMMTPEVLAKTKCIVGGAPGREDGEWDVNVPHTTRRVVVDEVREFVVSAVTGIL